MFNRNYNGQACGNGFNNNPSNSGMQLQLPYEIRGAGGGIQPNSQAHGFLQAAMNNGFVHQMGMDNAELNFFRAMYHQQNGGGDAPAGGGGHLFHNASMMSSGFGKGLNAYSHPHHMNQGLTEAPNPSPTNIFFVFPPEPNPHTQPRSQCQLMPGMSQPQPQPPGNDCAPAPYDQRSEVESVYNGASSQSSFAELSRLDNMDPNPVPPNGNLGPRCRCQLRCVQCAQNQCPVHGFQNTCNECGYLAASQRSIMTGSQAYGGQQAPNNASTTPTYCFKSLSQQSNR